MTVRGAACFRSLPSPALVTSPRLRGFAYDFTFVVLVIGVYFLARGIAPDRISFAVEVTERLIWFEQATGTFWEPTVQRVSIQYHAVQEVANFVYAYLHFPVLAAVGVWLWWGPGRDRFVFMRNVMFISMVIGLVFYYLVPAAPPRLLAHHGMDLGFTDTVFGGNTNVSYAQPSLILNEYAAIPSFHFGWIALASAAIWVNTRSRSLRTVALLLSLVMSWAIVASANHLFIDMALGGLVVGIAWYIAHRLQQPAPAQVTAQMVAMGGGK